MPVGRKRFPFRITISCCNTLFNEGIQRLLKENGLGVDYRIAVSRREKVLDTKPDILITDFHTLSVLSHRGLLNHKTGILLLWTDCLPKLEEAQLLEFIFHGLVGILLPEETTFAQLKKAIKMVTSGELWFTRKKLTDVISCMREMKAEVHQLTKRETEIVRMICKGFRNKEIAQELQVTGPSVKKHLNHLYKKAGVKDRLQLALHAIRHWQFYTNETLNQTAAEKKKRGRVR